MKRVTLALALAGAVVLTSTPVSAQLARPQSMPFSGVPSGPGNTTRGSPTVVGILATTPSRISSSRREMNRGRNTPFAVRMSPRETRRYADDLLERAEIRCDVAEAVVVARTWENLPIVEVYCREGSGLVIADTDPIQATDCHDLVPVDGGPEDPEYLDRCVLPGNVASVAAARQVAADSN